MVQVFEHKKENQDGSVKKMLIKAWVDGVELEDSALEQVQNCASMPFIHHHVALMPDVHAGIGATVGSVIPTRGAIIPAAVGVDIGCGMMAARLNLKARNLPDSLAKMRSAIEKAVPHGRSDHGGTRDCGAWGQVPISALNAWQPMDQHQIFEKHPKIRHTRAMNQLGTLGTGNHFIEVCLDENQDVWLMLHSGSRGLGNVIGSYFIEKAKREMEKYYVSLPDTNLAFFPEDTPLFDDYVEAVGLAQHYAKANRSIMFFAALDAIDHVLGRHVMYEDEAINCHHNYVEREHHFGANVWVTRKGAVRARVGDLGIIPGSMGAKSFIVRGKGNPDSFCSCSHGAGRRMSRTKARATFTMADHAAATTGVECRKDEGVIDETPAAYKSIDAVMAAQSDLVEIVHTLKQVLCVKG